MAAPLTIFTAVLAFNILVASAHAEPNKPPLNIITQQQNVWYQQARAALAKQDANARITPAIRGAAKNIILFVGDGMGVTTVTAARILEGQNKGLLGEEHELSFDQFKHTGLSKTYNVDAQTPDSAGTMTALMTGVKTDIGIIGLAEGVTRGKCISKSGQSLLSILELAELAGQSTGIVTTARVTHATPAATYAESVERGWESDAQIPRLAQSNGCVDIAEQLIHFSRYLNQQAGRSNINGIDVVLGGGRRNFLPRIDSPSKRAGARVDGRNLIKEWQSLHPSGQYVENKQALKNIKATPNTNLLGLFSSSHMHYDSGAAPDEPDLSEMTEKAIEVLQTNSKGYFLMVEGARIDHAHHAGNAYNALNETIALSNAVQKAIEMTNPNETLIIVTADHSHVFTLAGYPKRGNPILGKVIAPGHTTPSMSADGRPYTTVGYTNGLGFRDFGEETDANASIGTKPVARGDLSKVDTTSPGYHQEVGTPLHSETHGGEDVAIYASGPGAHLVSGTMEQNQIFHIMEFAGDLIRRASKGF